ncbi:MAG: hypothetical protein KKG09_06025, partial [Verrucomicrobia bacterium]|nr:hypothetical protein [Verrucomicrobiota bacterium]MBU4248251.1 hypothetical protein [Verrucomicrobiota bacterium]MBU4289566.1 hypothetical protein [Verrucomicrobiota bacterium]MBU4497541.1 hypothetical protein [Verrucomicrobiota bacterium]MCG2681266.1 hypothetical protein [Kiritimatiellia bacterium]
AKIDPAKKVKVETAIENLKKVIKDGETADIKSAMDALNVEMQAVSSDLYSQARGSQQSKQSGKDDSQPESTDAQEPPGHGPNTKKGGGDDVIDADFEMVDDKK